MQNSPGLIIGFDTHNLKGARLQGAYATDIFHFNFLDEMEDNDYQF